MPILILSPLTNGALRPVFDPPITALFAMVVLVVASALLDEGVAMANAKAEAVANHDCNGFFLELIICVI